MQFRDIDGGVPFVFVGEYDKVYVKCGPGHCRLNNPNGEDARHCNGFESIVPHKAWEAILMGLNAAMLLCDVYEVHFGTAMKAAKKRARP